MKHIAEITVKPVLSGKSSTPDGAINGNGDLSVILGNSGRGMRIYLAKCDLWYGFESYRNGGIRPLGHIDIDVPVYLYDNYRVYQDMDKGELRCHFEYENEISDISIKTLKTENAVLIKCGGNVFTAPELEIPDGERDGINGKYEKDGKTVIYRRFDGAECSYKTVAFAAGVKVCEGLYYYRVATNHDVEDPEALVLSETDGVTEELCLKKEKDHYGAWADFWSKSSVSLSDGELENCWYASLYHLAGCTGNKKFPPGLYGNFITVERPNWHSDYHLNYNYQAPFYSVCSSNHVEMTDCYASPLEEFYEKGRQCASRYGCRGILYPVAIMPGGLYAEMNRDLPHWFPRLFLGQKSNQIHPADIMVFRWKATRDPEYARKHAYPYIKECLRFFEDYAVKENGKYCVPMDAVHEVPYYKEDFNPKEYRKFINDKNNVLTLGMLRLCLEAELDMSEVLGVDPEKRKLWKDMLENLTPFPTYLRFGQRVYRYTSSGMAWNDTGDVGMQHIYPGGCVGLSDDEETLKIAKNTFYQHWNCWEDGNAISSFFPMAARIGIPPSLIVKKLKNLNKKMELPNKLHLHGGGCLENCSIFANTINEMALQSHQGVLRIFPAWDENVDCEFKTLRADGGYLVSSSIYSGKIGTSTVFCENDGFLKVVNPFKTSAKIETGGRTEFHSSRIIGISVKKGQTVLISDGTV